MLGRYCHWSVRAPGYPIVASRLHQTGQQRLLKRRYQRLLCSLHLHPVPSGWRHEPPGVLPGSRGFLVPHRRQTVALLSSLYILNVLHFNKTNTEVMGLVAFLSMMLVPYHSMSSQLKRMQTLNLKATSQLLLFFFHLRRSAKIKPFIKAAFSGSNPQLCCIQAGLQPHTLLWS